MIHAVLLAALLLPGLLSASEPDAALVATVAGTKLTLGDAKGQCYLRGPKNLLVLDIPYPCDFGTEGPGAEFSVEHHQDRGATYFVVIGGLSWNSEVRAECGQRLQTIRLRRDRTLEAFRDDRLDYDQVKCPRGYKRPRYYSHWPLPKASNPFEPGKAVEPR